MKRPRINVIAVLMVLLFIILIFNKKNKSDLEPGETISYSNSIIKYPVATLNVRKEPNLKSETIKILDKNEKIRTYDTLVNGFTIILDEDSTLLGWTAVQYL